MPTQSHALITIVIPTVCSTTRADSLRRAISSIYAAGPGITKILLAANGSSVDTNFATELRDHPHVRYIYFEEGSSPGAISKVVPLVDTEYFGFLDDDDELLPNGLLSRLAILQANSKSDILLSNGFLRKNGEDKLYLDRLASVPDKPLETFFFENWLPSCGALFRSSTVSPEYFKNYHPYAEWSWLAFRLALDKKQFCILNEPTFRIHADTPNSLSKSSEYGKAYISLYQRMLDLEPPLPIRQILKKRLCQAHHDVSAWHLGQGEIRKAFRHHLSSFQTPMSLRFLTYTRHIVAAALKR